MKQSEREAQENRRSFVWALAGIVLAALAVRVWAAFLSGASWYSGDTYTYFEMAEGISNGRPVSAFPNGYPLIIAAFGRAFGSEPLPSLLMGFQVAASTLVVLVVYGIGSALGSRRAGLLAAALAALWPNQINYVRQLLSEVPATLFLGLGIYLLLRRRHILSGAFLYAAAWTRSALFPVLPLVLFWMILSKRRAGGIVRCLSGAFVLLALNLGLLHTNVISAPNNVGDNFLFAIRSSSSENDIFTTDGFTPEQKAAPLEAYLTFAKENPAAFVAQRASAFWELWGPWPKRGGDRSPRSVPERLLIGLRFPLFVLALIELVRRRGSAPHWLPALPVIVITAVHTAFFSTSRFSYTVEPLALVLAGLLLVHLYGMLGREERREASVRTRQRHQ